ncbi:MAG: NmrA family NAD(P)-binding protein [Chloroflexi bacterium]|nr:NmrA family NAD(P)-binding protein [Chloroflexota bacterium]
MIIVTGAGGKTGRAVLQACSRRKLKVRAVVHHPDQTQKALDLGAEEALWGDIQDDQFLEEAFRDGEAVYHICPNVHPEEISIGRAVIQAARSAGVGHIVYHSVLHPQVEVMPHHWKKLRVEEALFASGLEFTILQPTVYMQNVLAQWKSITERGVYLVPYPVETRLSLLDLEDLGEVVAAVLCEPQHRGAVYELVGTPPMSQQEVAEALSAVIGRSVRAEESSLDVWERQARAAGQSDFAIGTLLGMFRYYAEHGLWGSPQVLRWLLGREPHTFQEFLSAYH